MNIFVFIVYATVSIAKEKKHLIRKKNENFSNPAHFG